MEQSFAIQILFNDTFSGARKDAGVLFFDMNRFSKSTFGSPATEYPGFEVAIPNNSLFAVVAKAKACSYFSGFVNLGRRFRNNFKLSKPLSDDGYFGRHCIAFLSALFSGGRGHTTPTPVTILTFSLQPSQP